MAKPFWELTKKPYGKLTGYKKKDVDEHVYPFCQHSYLEIYIFHKYFQATMYVAPYTTACNGAASFHGPLELKLFLSRI